MTVPHSTSPTARRKRLLFASILLLAAIVPVLLAAEVYLRVRATQRDRQAALAAEQAQNPEREISRAERLRPSQFEDIIYELRPGIDGLFRGRRLRTNRFGFRGDETTINKPPGVMRIVGLGDSHMFGWGVHQEEVYLARLPHEIAARLPPCTDGTAGATHDRIETLNFAVPGYNTVMEAATLEHRALPFAPDLVVLHFVGNDEQIPHFLDPAAAQRVGTEERPTSYLWDLVRQLWTRADSQDAEDPEDTGDGEGLADAAAQEAAPSSAEPVPGGARPGRRLAKDRYGHMAGPAAFSAAMDRIGELARSRNLPVVVVALGHAERTRLQEAVARNGFRYFNFAPSLREDLAKRGLPDDKATWTREYDREAHPNARAHGLFAGALAQDLVENGLVPGCQASAP